ncbi:MAG: hypothetical protein EXR78_09740 [Deltaproteobacteria bacterium]|nr:hypothetical protein [Deltaproteobacteria bacterium]
MSDLALPLMLLLGGCLIVLEHLFPAHPLHRKPEWYIRAVIMNALQLLVFLGVDGLQKNTGVGTVLFWSVDDTKIAKLAKHALFHRILALDKMRFYSGDLLASKTRPTDRLAKPRERG